MSPDEVEAELGADVAAEVSRLTRAILARGNEIAAERGILIADTKVEFGVSPDGDRRPRPRRRGADPGLVALLAGRPLGAGAPAAVLRQAVRPRLADLGRVGLGPQGRRAHRRSCPSHVVEQTRAKYVEAYERLTGETF